MKKIVLIATTLIAFSMNIQAHSDGSRPDMSKLCNGKAINTRINTKANGHDIQGACQLGFKANNPGLLERGAMRDPAIQKSCVGKAKGTVINVKVNGKFVSGKCDIVFKSNIKR